jgi:4-amino-4-deoxy-L-arabinose transferase-like glycosyltransferase
MLIIYLFSSILVLLYTLVLGIGLTKLLRKEFFYFPLIFSIFLGGLSFILWILKVQLWLVYLIPFFIFLWPFCQKVKKLNKNEKVLITIFILQFLFYVILQLFIYIYPLGRDWVNYYKFSLSISENSFQLKSVKPVFFCLFEGAFLTLFGKNFYIAQIVSSLAGALIVFPFYLISNKFLKSKFVYISLLFLIFNPFTIEGSLYNWSKMQVTMFVLYFTYFFLKNKHTGSYTSSISAFLSHGLSLCFVLPAYAIQSIKGKKQWLKLFILFLFSVITIILIKNYAGYNDSLIFYPFAVNGWEKVMGKSFWEVWPEFISKSIYYHFFVRIVNFLNTVFPVILVVKLLNYFVKLPILELHKVINFESLPIIYHYFHSLPGALTIGVYIFFVISIIKNIKIRLKEGSNPNWEFILLFIILPILIAVSFFGWIQAGIVRVALQPLIPIATIFAVNEMTKYNKKIVYIVFIIMIFELILFFVLYNDFIKFSVENLKSLGDYDTLNIETINKLVFNHG